jgi:hypothetical protein
MSSADGSNCGRFSNTPFHRPEQPSTLKAYAVLASKLVLMLMRENGLNLDLHSYLRESLRQLRLALTAKYSQDEDTDFGPEDDNKPLMLLHGVLLNLWMYRWNPTDTNPIPDPTACFLALSTLRADGSFEHPKVVTKPIAVLCFVLRCTFKFEAIRRCYGKDNPMALEQEMIQLSHWFVEKQHTPFNSMRNYTHLASAIVYNTPTMPAIWWVDPVSHRVLRFKGARIELDGLCTMFSDIQDQMVNLYEETVMLGLGLRVDYTSVADDLGNTMVGYLFLTDARNVVFQDRDLLFRAILNHPDLHARFIVVDAQNNHSWNVLALHAWLRGLAELELFSITCAEYLTGGPARGTEIEAMQFANTKTRQRNFFAMGKYIGMVRMYLKTNAMTGIDRLIPSAFDALHADVLIQTLAVARPFAMIAASICFPQDPEVAALYSSQLWMAYGRSVTTEDITGCMKRLTGQHLAVELNMRDWRQVGTAFRRTLTKDEFELMNGEAHLDSLDAQQMGHSRTVDLMHYGRTTDALIGSEDVLPALLASSCAWQRAVLVPPGA